MPLEEGGGRRRELWVGVGGGEVGGVVLQGVSKSVEVSVGRFGIM